jgi:signal peptidase I
MRIHRSWFQPLLSAFLLAVMALLWVLFAPVQFGGGSSYVIVAGASMEPTLSMGDLVIVRESSVYEVGDIVTYHHPLAGPIIHRIIDREGEQFTFQGDNNDWIDSYAPTVNDMVGKLWLRLPAKGQLLNTLRVPAVLAGLAILVAMSVFATFRTTDRKAKSSQQGARNRKSLTSPPQFRDGVEGLVFVLAAIAFTSGVLAIASFTKSINIEKIKQLDYEMQGHFEYKALAPPGIYNSEAVSTGDPIYFKLTDNLDVTFEFLFSAEELHDLEGNIRMDYELSDPGGWRRSFELYPMTSVTEESTVINGKIDFDEVHATIADLEERTGFERPYYTFSISPMVVAKARINGNETLEVFNPRLDFRLEDLQLYLYSQEPDVTALEQITQAQSSFVEQPYLAPNHLSILGIDVPVLTARWISVIGGSISSIGFLIVGLLYMSASRDGEAARIGVRYGSMLVDIREGNFVNGYHRIEVEDIDDLARFAERTGGVILHEFKTSRHHYFVQEGNITYHYATAVRRRRSDRTKGNGSKGSKSGNGKTSSNKSNGKPASRVKNRDQASINLVTTISIRVKAWFDAVSSRFMQIDLGASWSKVVEQFKRKGADVSQRIKRGFKG